ncbi:acid phosphatase 1 [Lolium perenne]|uniref:acid phosphatase 1 n=1 Tax=Lolium perenne TaxID=4522 RepID=UPI0021EADB1A|nr:acid phosphatase 1 [Lolium perenne]
MASLALQLVQLVLFTLLLLPQLLVSVSCAKSCFWPSSARDDGGCLSWRVMVEANNARGWRTVPAPCVGYVRSYMTRGQYGRDLDSVMEQVSAYVDQIAAADDGLDAWIFDIDDTCLSNLLYYQAKRFGAYDPLAFKNWASQGACPGIPAVLQLFMTLQDKGFKLFLLSGRDEETLGSCTSENLESEGFSGYERLLMRTPDYRGQSSSVFKSAMRKQLVDEGYRIRGNVGDQWSDLQGDNVGDRVFKIPNPMYFVP